MNGPGGLFLQASPVQRTVGWCSGMDEFNSKSDGSWNQPLSSPAPHTDAPAEPHETAIDLPLAVVAPQHPLDRPDDARHAAAEAARIKLAWARLIWLLSFLAVLLAISYLVPYIAEQTQYAVTRGRQRAEYDFAQKHLGETPLADLSQAYQMLSQVVGPSVVHINTQGGSADLFPRAASVRPPRIPAEGQGSGFIADGSGYIVTNHHVVRDARGITVSLADGRRIPATLVGADPETDLAVLKIKADKLTPAAWGDSDAMSVGALVWAVGSPFGLERSITSGILSAKHRAGMAGSLHQDFLQSDAAVNPGNSGGPLVDSGGRVIGVNTAIVGEAYQGISFSIPSNVAREVFERIKAEGLVRRGWLGVQLADMTEEEAKELGLAEVKGVYIAGLFQQAEGSPAQRAGLMAGDVILTWNGEFVVRPADLSRLVAKTAIGSTAKVIVFRDEQELTLEVVVGERPVFE
jgi:serine protease Do